ncbi:MAG: hypothetical protein OEN20_11110, partial [Gammaproteobacteria bacterium]|nr:hypothetical protein [Gammaproteobacteria bacterium]
MTQKRNLFYPWLILVTVLSVAGCAGSDGGNEIRDSTDVIGVISATPRAEVDGDVNELLAVFTANQTFANAQSLPNPVSIGGYVNEPFAGAPRGRSSDAGDTRDLFRVTMAQDQVIGLTIADGQSDSSIAGTVENDLELYLLDGACSDATPQCMTNCSKSPSSAMIIDSSTADGNAPEQITVPAFDTYFVEVCVASGASNYVLTLVESLAAAGGFDATADFVPGEVIVRFRETAEQTAGGDRQIMAASIGLQAKAGGPGRALLMDIGSGGERERAMQQLGVTPETLGQVARATGAASADKRDTLAVVQALRERADVMYADP